jgi:predicted nucleotidyltransferase
MNIIKTEIANYFKNQDGIVAVYLFGSHATKSTRPFSDIDIGIIAEHADIDRIKNKFGQYIVDLGRILRKDIHPVMLNIAPESLLLQVFAKGQCLVVNHRKALSEFRMNAFVKIAEFGYYKSKMQARFTLRLYEQYGKV